MCRRAPKCFCPSRLGTDSKGSYPSFRIVYHFDEKEEVYDSYIDSGARFPEGYNKVTPLHR
jgi:hypothetical protein